MPDYNDSSLYVAGPVLRSGLVAEDLKSLDVLYGRIESWCQTESATVARCAVYRGSYPVGSLVEVNRASGGPAFVTITDLDPSEVLILGSAGA